MILGLKTKYEHLKKGLTTENLGQQLAELKAGLDYWAGKEPGLPRIVVYEKETAQFRSIRGLQVPEHMVLFLVQVELLHPIHPNWISASCQVVFEENDVAFINGELFQNDDAHQEADFVHHDYRKTWANMTWADGLDALLARILSHFVPVQMPVGMLEVH